MIDLDFLTGKKSDQLISFLETKHLVHQEMHQNLINLFKAAKHDGFELAATSTFRSYETQKRIWNEKVQGIRPVLDSNSIPVNIVDKSYSEILFLILRWSAIPGGSRHHWGSDLDIYDKSTVSFDYKVQLIPSEYDIHGPFYQMTLWLNENMQDYGFFRPYSYDKGGIAPEPWHLSYRPISETFLREYTFERFKEHLQKSDFLLLQEAQKNCLEIYQRYIQL